MSAIIEQAGVLEDFLVMPDDELAASIEAAREALGSRVVILGHHYQRDDVIRHADLTGDSYQLSVMASQTDADYIVFCGVHFMAESADMLVNRPERLTERSGLRVPVVLPDMAAGCSMADMAGIEQVENAWAELGEVIDTGDITPVTYINSAASLKAFCGRHGGIVCTSSNAAAVLKWAFERRSRVLFFPDQHLGRNTGVRLGYDPDADMCVWNPFQPLGGNDPETIRRAKFLLWKGHCSVHQRFTVEQVRKARTEHPGVNVLVHPECPLEVVRESDLNGSTEFIIKTVEAAPAGSVWAVGTEINLVQRLAKEHPDKTVFCLDPQICPCSTMYRIHPSFLCWALENLAEGRVVNEVRVPEKIRDYAKVALARMLTVCA